MDYTKKTKKELIDIIEYLEIEVKDLQEKLEESKKETNTPVRNPNRRIIKN